MTRDYNNNETTVRSSEPIEPTKSPSAPRAPLSTTPTSASGTQEPSAHPIRELTLLYETDHHDVRIVPTTLDPPDSAPTSSPPSSLSKEDDSASPPVPLYYVLHHSYHPSKPSITLRTHSPTGPIVGVAEIQLGRAQPAILGLGDPTPTSAHTVIWEVLNLTSKDHSCYSFSFLLPNSYERKTFLWKRTHAFPSYIEGKKSFRHMKLVEEESGEVVGLYVHNGWLRSWRKKGRMLFWKSWGGEWERWVLLAALAIMELARRDRN